MKRINFERIEVFVDIDKTRCSVENYKRILQISFINLVEE